MSPNCVETFYDYLENTSNYFNVLRFNNYFINDLGVQITPIQELPNEETAANFAKARLLQRRYSSLAEHIFSRKAYKDYNCFAHYPAAWFADDATWAKFAMDSGIKTLEGGIVHVRQSDENISNSATSYQKEKIEATYKYLEYIHRNNLIDDLEDKDDVVMRFILNQYSKVNLQLSGLDIIKMGIRNQTFVKAGYLKNFYRLLLHNKKMKKLQVNG